jgi:adenylosuccinate lyase
MATTETYTHDTYLSPFTWRYGSRAMRRLWGETHKRLLWRRLWVALAEAQHAAGIVKEEQVADLRKHADRVDIARSHQIEAEIHHDLMAEVHAFAEQAKVGGGIIHLGATSMDIEDNADALRLRDAMDLVIGRAQELLRQIVGQALRWADVPAMAFTHLQPAEPTTVGYRLSQYAQDLIMDLEELRNVRRNIKGKGIKGAVGTSAAYTQLLDGSPMSARTLESNILERLDLEAFEVATQTYPRKQDWLVVNALAGLAGTLYKFAFDLRLLQAPTIGEWGEPFAERQVGSSAMPFKRNPINAEKIDSLARYVATLPSVAWHNAAHSLLERTLDDSANRRVVLPQAFLAADELLNTATRLVHGLDVREAAIAATMARYGPFAATERLLMEAVKVGANRQEFHEILRRHSIAAWNAMSSGQSNPLVSLIVTDPLVTQYLSPEVTRHLLDAGAYVGDAPERTRVLARKATEARWGRTLLIGTRLYVARGNILRATDIESGEDVVREEVRGGEIATLVLTPDQNGIILHFEAGYDWRGISNVLRLSLSGAEEWRAEMVGEVRPWGYNRITSDGTMLRAYAVPLRDPLILDWESGLVRAEEPEHA